MRKLLCFAAILFSLYSSAQNKKIKYAENVTIGPDGVSIVSKNQKGGQNAAIINNNEQPVAKKDSIVHQPVIVDTIVQINLKLNDFRALLYYLDINIDSKRLSKDITDMLTRSSQLLQVADKPKR